MTWLWVGEQERVDVPKQEREENNKQTQTKECEKKSGKKAHLMSVEPNYIKQILSLQLKSVLSSCQKRALWGVLLICLFIILGCSCLDVIDFFSLIGENMSATTAGISELLLVSYYLNLLFFHSQIWDYKFVITKMYTLYCQKYSLTHTSHWIQLFQSSPWPQVYKIKYQCMQTASTNICKEMDCS